MVLAVDLGKKEKNDHETGQFAGTAEQESGRSFAESDSRLWQ